MPEMYVAIGVAGFVALLLFLGWFFWVGGSEDASEAISLAQKEGRPIPQYEDRKEWSKFIGDYIRRVRT